MKFEEAILLVNPNVKKGRLGQLINVYINKCLLMLCEIHL
jgi:hypothetical protein